jgi:predicted amidophosphoribosyltransferase
VFVLAEAISKRLGIPLANCVKRARNIPQLKNVYDLDERLKLLDGLHEVDTPATQDKKILLFDDLYRSGATMNAITAALYEQGKASEVFALTITRTRSNQ